MLLQNKTLRAANQKIKQLDKTSLNTRCVAGGEFVWPSMQTLVSRFDWAGPGILRARSSDTYVSLSPLFSASQHLLSLPLICLLICASDLSAWNRFSLCSPSGNLEWGWPNLARAKQSPRADLMYFDAVCENDTHTAQTLREMEKKNTTVVSVVLCFSPTAVSTSSTISI